MRASADIVSDKGVAVGRADFVDLDGGVLVTLQLSKLMPGVHAVHIHETGRCEPPTFESAGGHFNPGGTAHGFESQKGFHAGDLPNIYMPAEQFFKTEIVVPGVTLEAGDRSLLDSDGSALVIHLGPDDYRTDPAGASGSRVACGVIKATPADDPDPRVLTSIESIAVPLPEPRELAGRRIELANVQVTGRAGERALWVGQGQHQLLVVVSDDVLNGRDIPAGQQVSVIGMLDMLPASGHESVTREWQLNAKDEEMLRKQRVFVRATRVDVKS